MSRKKKTHLLLGGILTTVLGYIVGVSSEPFFLKEPQKSPLLVQEQKEETPPPSSPDQNLFPVLHIIDGDTIVALVNGHKEKIRVIGIDTPETEKDNLPQECYADEATDRVREMLSEKSVTLLKNKKGDNRDKYGRMLRYVFVNGKDMGATLISEGYAFAFRRYPHDRMSYYIAQESQAKEQKKGMWNSENCSYW